MVSLHPKRMLVPTDFSDQASRAVDEAISLVDKPGQLTVLHVAPPITHFAEADPVISWNTVNDEAREGHLLEMLQKKYSDPKYAGVHFHIAFGSPAEEIARVAKEDQAELIMLPSHGRTGLARIMIGSVAERVVRLAHCPVLVLRD